MRCAISALLLLLTCMSHRAPGRDVKSDRRGVQTSNTPHSKTIRTHQSSFDVVADR